MATDRFELEISRQIDAMEVDEHQDTNGVPPHLLEGLAQDVVRLLVANGIDPHTAYYRGRDGDPVNYVDDRKRVTELERWGDPDDEVAEAQETQNVYDDILEGEPLARSMAIEEALGRQIDPLRPMYQLGKYGTLFSDDPLINPIYLAGVSVRNKSFIDVYDGPIVDGLDPTDPAEKSKVVEISDEELALAAIARIHLDFDIINEEL